MNGSIHEKSDITMAHDSHHSAVLSQKQDFLIGILSFNHPEITQRTLESCLAQVSPQKIVLLHNGSEQKWIEAHRQRYPEVTHIILPENLGFTGGANGLLSAVFERAPWCLFVTNDIQLINLGHPPVESGLWAPRIFRRSQSMIDSTGGLLDLKKGQLVHCREESAFLNPPPEYLPYVPGTAFWLDKITFSRGGPFDTQLGTYWEDVDFSQRVRLVGAKLGFTGATELIHSVGKTCHKKPYYTNYLFHRNRYIVTWRYLSVSHQKITFFGRYWIGWTLGLMQLLIKRRFEGVSWKLLILKDLIKRLVGTRTGI